MASPGDHGSGKSKKAATTKSGKLDDKSIKDEKINKVDEKPNKDEKFRKVEDKSIKVEKISKVAETKDEGGDSKNGSEQKQKLIKLADNPTDKNAEAMVGDDITDEKKALHLSSSDPKGEVKKPEKKKIIRKVVKRKIADKKATLATDESADKKPNLDTDEPVGKHDEKSVKDFENKLNEQENIVLVNDSSAEPEKPRTFVRKRLVRKVAAGKASLEEDNNVTEKKIELDTKNQEEKAKNDKAFTLVAEEDTKNQEKKAKNDIAFTVDVAQPTSVPKVAGKKKIIRRVIKKRVVVTDKPGAALAKNGAQEESNTSVVKTVKEEDLPIVKKKQDLVESNLSENKSEDDKKLAIEKDGSNEKKTNEVLDNKKVTRTDKASKTEKQLPSSSELDPLKNKSSEKDQRNAKREGSRQDKENRSKNSKEKVVKQDTRKSSKEAKEKLKSDEPPKQPGLFLKTKKTKGSKVY